MYLKSCLGFRKFAHVTKLSFLHVGCIVAVGSDWIVVYLKSPLGF